MKESKSSRKLTNIQGLRGIAVVMVLLYHLYTYEKRSSPDHLFGDYMLAGAGGVDLFFVISGLVMTLTTRNVPNRIFESWKFLIRRAARIYPLYWFYSIVALTIILSLPSLVTRDGGANSITIWSSFLLLPSHGAPLVGQGWTLVHEMYFYSVFALFLLVNQQKRGFLIAVWALTLLVGYSFSLSQRNPFFSVAFSLLTFEFLFGCVIGNLVISGKLWGGWTFIVFGIIGFVLAKVWLTDSSTDRALTFGIPSAVLVYGAVTLELKNEIIAPHWLVFLGDISYSLYLSHIFTLSAGFFLWRWFMKSHSHVGPLDNILAITTIFVSAILVSILSYFFVEHPLMSVTRSWMASQKERMTVIGPEKS